MPSWQCTARCTTYKRAAIIILWWRSVTDTQYITYTCVYHQRESRACGFQRRHTTCWYDTKCSLRPTRHNTRGRRHHTEYTVSLTRRWSGHRDTTRHSHLPPCNQCRRHSVPTLVHSNRHIQDRTAGTPGHQIVKACLISKCRWHFRNIYQDSRTAVHSNCSIQQWVWTNWVESKAVRVNESWFYENLCWFVSSIYL